MAYSPAYGVTAFCSGLIIYENHVNSKVFLNYFVGINPNLALMNDIN
jgi:hypothetical protein